jgi:hydrogenase maturation protease
MRQRGIRNEERGTEKATDSLLVAHHSSLITHPSLLVTTLVIGLGNPLLGDEGIGTRVVGELKELDLPAGVEVVEGGTAGLGLIGLMEGYQRVIIVDAADMGRPPGHVVRFTPSEVQFKTAEAPLSLHQIGLGEALVVAEALEMAPAELIIIGVQPSRLEMGVGLSPEVEGTIPQAVRMILDELDAG